MVQDGQRGRQTGGFRYNVGLVFYTSAMGSDVCLYIHLHFSFILFLFAVFIREIKEVRRGLGSKDFDRNPESARRLDPNCCLAIFYGTEFKLKTLSLVGKLKNALCRDVYSNTFWLESTEL